MKRILALLASAALILMGTATACTPDDTDTTTTDTTGDGEAENTDADNTNADNTDADNTNADNTNADNGDENSTAPTITWATNPDFSDLTLAESGNEIDITVSAPEGIETFTVKVSSTLLELAMTLEGLSNPMDFIKDATAIEDMEVLGLEIGDLYHKTEASFSLSKLADYLYGISAAGATHTFTVNVTDQKEQGVEKTVTLLMPSDTDGD